MSMACAVRRRKGKSGGQRREEKSRLFGGEGSKEGDRKAARKRGEHSLRHMSACAQTTTAKEGRTPRTSLSGG